MSLGDSGALVHAGEIDREEYLQKLGDL